MLLSIVLAAHAGPRADALRDAMAGTHLTGFWASRAWSSSGACEGVRVTATTATDGVTCVAGHAGVRCAPVWKPDVADLCDRLVDPAPAWLHGVLDALAVPDESPAHHVFAATVDGAALVRADGADWIAVPTAEGLRLAPRPLEGSGLVTLLAVHDATALTGRPAWALALRTESGGSGTGRAWRTLTVVTQGPDSALSLGEPLRVGVTLWWRQLDTSNGAKTATTVGTALVPTFAPGVLHLAPGPMVGDAPSAWDEDGAFALVRANVGDWRLVDGRFERAGP